MRFKCPRCSKKFTAVLSDSLTRSLPRCPNRKCNVPVNEDDVYVGLLGRIWKWMFTKKPKSTKSEQIENVEQSEIPGELGTVNYKVRGIKMPPEFAPEIMGQITHMPGKHPNYHKAANCYGTCTDCGPNNPCPATPVERDTDRVCITQFTQPPIEYGCLHRDIRPGMRLGSGVVEQIPDKHYETPYEVCIDLGNGHGALSGGLLSLRASWDWPTDSLFIVVRLDQTGSLKRGTLFKISSEFLNQEKPIHGQINWTTPGINVHGFFICLETTNTSDVVKVLVCADLSGDYGDPERRPIRVYPLHLPSLESVHPGSEYPGYAEETHKPLSAAACAGAAAWIKKEKRILDIILGNTPPIM